jgi:hypothetical protein
VTTSSGATSRWCGTRGRLNGHAGTA